MPKFINFDQQKVVENLADLLKRVIHNQLPAPRKLEENEVLSIIDGWYMPNKVYLKDLFELLHRYENDGIICEFNVYGDDQKYTSITFRKIRPMTEEELSEREAEKTTKEARERERKTDQYNKLKRELGL